MSESCLRDQFKAHMKDAGLKTKAEQVEWLLDQMEGAHHMLTLARTFSCAGGDLVATAVELTTPEEPDTMRLTWAVYHPCDNTFLTRFGNKFIPRPQETVPDGKFWSKVTFPTALDAIMAGDAAREAIVHGHG